MQLPLALQMPGFGEMLLIAAIGLILFGKRLPEVGRSLGKGIVEFKKGIQGIEDDVDVAANRSTAPQQRTFTAPTNLAPYRFDPHTGQPLDPSIAPRAAQSAPPPTQP